jgi:hypothetical protein
MRSTYPLYFPLQFLLDFSFFLSPGKSWGRGVGKGWRGKRGRESGMNGSLRKDSTAHCDKFDLDRLRGYSWVTGSRVLCHWKVQAKWRSGRGDGKVYNMI